MKTCILFGPCNDLRFVPASTRFEPLRKLIFCLDLVMIYVSYRLEHGSNRFDNLHFAWALARFTFRTGFNTVRTASKTCTSLGICYDLRFAPASTLFKPVRKRAFRLGLGTLYDSHRLKRGSIRFETLHVAWTVSRFTFRAGFNTGRTGSTTCISLGPCDELRVVPAATRLERVRKLACRLDCVANCVSPRSHLTSTQ